MYKILVVDDEENIRESLKLIFSSDEYDVDGVSTAAECFKTLEEREYDLIFLDVKLPDGNGIEMVKQIKEKTEDTMIVMVTAYGDTEKVVSAVRDGAYDFLVKPFKSDKIRLTAQNALKVLSLVKENKKLREALYHNINIENIIDNNSYTKDTIVMIKNACRYSNSNVFITGESGTGKTFIAKLIHHEGNRKNNEFVDISCTSIPSTLFESEFFGHEKGAFTDAKQKKIGLLEQGHGGTIFLDEIGSMPFDQQGKILKVIQQKTIKRVGSFVDIPIDVRFVAATNKDIVKEVENGFFRKDLFYRLSVIFINLPPLRYRKSEISTLCLSFIGDLNIILGKKIKGISSQALEMLNRYDFPGNIRELRNIIERAMMLCESDEIQVKHIFIQNQSSSPVLKPSIEDDSMLMTDIIPLKDMEKKYAKMVVDSLNGNKTEAAKYLQISRPLLYKLLDSQEE